MLKSEKLPALTMIDNLCCSFLSSIVPSLPSPWPGAKLLSHLLLSVPVTGTHSSVIRSGIKRLRCVLQVLRMSRQAVCVSHSCTSQQKCAKQCAELILTVTRVTRKVRIIREWRIGSEEKGNHLSLISHRISEFFRKTEENHKNSQHNRYSFRDSIRLLFAIARNVTAWSSVLGLTYVVPYSQHNGFHFRRV
jgi:hypothetical protein